MVSTNLDFSLVNDHMNMVTTGLDSNSAMIVMESLRSFVQRNGMTICTVIHQPRKTIYELMDNVILLGTGGKNDMARMVLCMFFKFRRLCILTFDPKNR